MAKRPAMKIAVFTVCMPEYTLEEGAAKLAEWGYDGVEWRVTTAPPPGEPVRNFWSGNRCTVDQDRVVEIAPALRKLCNKHKLGMPSLGTYLGYGQLDLLERVLEAAQMMGVRALRVGVDGYDGKTKYDKLLANTVKGYEKVIRLCEEYRVKPLAEIHMGNIIPSCSAARRFADHFDPGDMGIIHDAGNMIHEGYEQWKMGLEILGKYLAHVHVKNASWSIRSADPDGNLRWGPASDTLRHGRVDWADVIDALKKVNYKGWLSLEDFAPGDTDTKMADNIAYVRSLI